MHTHLVEQEVSKCPGPLWEIPAASIVQEQRESATHEREEHGPELLRAKVRQGNRERREPKPEAVKCGLLDSNHIRGCKSTTHRLQHRRLAGAELPVEVRFAIESAETQAIVLREVGDAPGNSPPRKVVRRTADDEGQLTQTTNDAVSARLATSAHAKVDIFLHHIGDAAFQDELDADTWMDNAELAKHRNQNLFAEGRNAAHAHSP